MKNLRLSILLFIPLMFSGCIENEVVSKKSLPYEQPTNASVSTNSSILLKDFTLRHLPTRWQKWRVNTNAEGYSEADAINDFGMVVGGSCVDSCSSYQAYGYWHNIFVPYPTFGGYAGVAYGVNNRGEIVGQADTNVLDSEGSSISVAFIIKHGKMTKLGNVPGYANSQAVAINNSGQIVGRCYNSDPEDTSAPMRAVIFNQGGEVVDMGTLGGTVSLAFGINDSGNVVGRARTAAGEDHAFIYANGRMTDLGTLGGTLSTARDVNNAGTIVGGSRLEAPGQRHAFVYSHGVMADLGTLGGDFSEAFSVNDRGTIVGASDNTSGERHAFVYDKGVMKDIGTLGGTYSVAFCINNSGEIVGESETSDGWVHAFLYRHGRMIDMGVAKSQIF